MLLGFLLKLNSELGEAEDVLRQAIQKAPALAAGYYFLGQVLEQRGDLPSARDHYQRAVRLAPDEATLRAALGAAYLAENQVESAIRELQQAASLDPSSRTVQYLLAKALRQGGRLGEAKLELKRVEASKRHDREHQQAALSVTLGADQMKIGETDQAIPHFETALTLVPSFPDAHHWLGIAWARKNDLNKANEHFSRALQARPRDPIIRFNF